MTTNINAYLPRTNAPSTAKLDGVRAAWEKSGVLAPRSSAAAATRADQVNDTVVLSEGGQKVVNLARGNDLAEQIRKAPVDEAFSAALRKASQDIQRIGRLFGETIKSAFAFWR